jgi:transcriptional regulator with GAF, ATPase, and Fis domain
VSEDHRAIELAFDRYRRLALLGEGSSGQVWLVEDQFRPGTRLALKEPGDGDGHHDDALLHEFVMLARLRHPGLVEAFDIDLISDLGPRFTLEYVDGETLTTVVEREGPDVFLEMAAEALRVLAFLHQFGLIHRDLKPENMLVRRRARLGCRLVLLDLGLATSTHATRDEAQPGPVGTLPYLAPELFGGAQADSRSELYSLGALLYEVLHGAPPHLPDEKDLNAFIERVRSGHATPPPLPAGYPPGLATWLDELLSVDPAHRPAEAREALARLNTACGTSFAVETATCRAARLASDPPAGRDAEIRELMSLLTPQGGPRVVWLCAPAGGGKSRLLRFLRTEAILEGWMVATPEAGEANSTTYLKLLRARAGEQKTLILIDEVDAAGPRTLDFLDRIAREGKASPLQVVAALRPGEVTRTRLKRLLADTGTVPTLHRLDLPPLGRESTGKLAERATGNTALSDSRLNWLLDTSEGNPLMLEALLVEAVWDKGGGKRSARILERSVVARLNLLSETSLVWLEALAVLGGDVSGSTVATLAGLEEQTAQEAGKEARVASLARLEHGRWFPASRWVTEQVGAGISSRRRAGIHRKAAELLIAIDGPKADPWRLARLWSAASNQTAAREAAVRAAEHSSDEGAPEEAAERLAFALHHCPRRAPQRYDLRIRQAGELLSAGQFQAAARAYGAALRLAPNDAEHANMLGLQAHALVLAGRFARARTVAETALTLAEAAGLVLEKARAQKAIAMVRGRLGQEAKAIPLLEEALEAFHTADDLPAEAETLQILAACKSRLKRDDAESDFQRAITLQRRIGQKGSELKSLIGLATIHLTGGQLDKAGDLLEEVRLKAHEYGHLSLLETALSKLASLATERGKLDQALTLCHEALDQALHLGEQNRLMVGRMRLAESLTACGRPAEAATLLREVLHAPLEKVEPDMVDTARLLLANALLEIPGAEDSEIAVPLRNAMEGFRSRHKTRSLLMALAIEMERRLRSRGADPFEAIRLEFDALAGCSEHQLEPEMCLRAGLARGTHLLLRGDPAAAREIAITTARSAADAGLPAFEARAKALLGDALEQLGEAEEAETVFQSAVTLLDAAAGLITDETIRQSFLERTVFRTLRGHRPMLPGVNERRLLALYEMIRALNSESDPDALLETILDMALRASSAERGMILLREPKTEDAFSVHVSRNLEEETRQDAEQFSRSIVAQAGAGRSILALDAGRDQRFRDLKSVSLFGIRSLMCVPLRSRGTIIGTVYLDSRQTGVLMTPQDLRFIEAFADHAALALENARERQSLVRENKQLRSMAETRTRFGDLVGRSTAMLELFDLIEKVAESKLPVLIQGESGTGKELVARAVHFNGPRKRKILLSENCAAIPESLLESELFGHVRGAFTGAERDRQGLFEQADGGTLFLDEVGDMSAAMQARLLRVLQEGEVRRVGGERYLKVDVRVLAATHRNLQQEVRAGRFREDLMYRLQVLPVTVPPLRERPEDIAPLIDHLLERIGRERGQPAATLDPRVANVLEQYDWPGNVRQLENTLQRLVLLSSDRTITLDKLQSDETFHKLLLIQSEAGDDPLFAIKAGEREQVRKALTAASGNRIQAAKLLGVSRATIYRKIKDLDL